MHRRKLSCGEAEILETIQECYGRQNTAEDVFLTDVGEAVIFVKAHDGRVARVANLTTLAELRATGAISTLEELKSNYLGPS
jgi:hypothetical protein